MDPIISSKIRSNIPIQIRFVYTVHTIQINTDDYFSFDKFRCTEQDLFSPIDNIPLQCKKCDFPRNTFLKQTIRKLFKIQYSTYEWLGHYVRTIRDIHKINEDIEITDEMSSLENLTKYLA